MEVWYLLSDDMEVRELVILTFTYEEAMLLFLQRVGARHLELAGGSKSR